MQPKRTDNVFLSPAALRTGVEMSVRCWRCVDGMVVEFTGAAPAGWRQLLDATQENRQHPYGDEAAARAAPPPGPGDALRFSASSCLSFAGEVVGSDGVTSDVEFAFEVGAGSSRFELDGNRAVLTGSLGRNTFRQIRHLIANHPEVDTLVLEYSDGSEDDRINVETGRLVREAGLVTVVPADGEIYSGAVDLFAAGVARFVEPGGVVGVHAWCCAPDNRGADELDADDPAHEHLISFLTEMLGDELGREFYFFTIRSAPPDGIHEMTANEVAHYLLTE